MYSLIVHISHLTFHISQIEGRKHNGAKCLTGSQGGHVSSPARPRQAGINSVSTVKPVRAAPSKRAEVEKGTQA